VLPLDASNSGLAIRRVCIPSTARITSVIEIRDGSGRVRRYSDGGELRPFHVELKPQPTDLHRNDIIKAEHELIVMEIIFDHFDDLSGVARTRLDDALRIIYRALQIERRAVGLQKVVS